MAQKPEEQLREVGSKLDPPPSSKDVLLKLLKQSANCLSELEQSPPAPVLSSMQPFLDVVTKPEILKHQDKDVKLLVASCICEITRITAPEAPYSDNIMKDVFELIVNTFNGLNDTGSPSFRRRVVILETVAKYRSCVVMLDLECDDLVNELFTTFFVVARDDHPENVLSSMQNIMVVLLEESEEVQENLLLLLLSKLGRNRSDVTSAARRLAMNVIEQCAPKIESDIKQFLISSMSGDSRLLNWHIDYHEVVYDLYRCAPQTLSGVTPYLTGELLTDQLDTRLKAVGLVGDLFSLPGSVISEEFRPIFSEFLKRLTDRVVEVRMAILDCVRSCLLSDPSRAEASQIISALCDRLLDYDENVRKQVVAVICDVASHALALVPINTIKLVAERLRDKAVLVKKYTMERLAELFRIYCLTCGDGKVNSDEFDWIPGKILRCFYDKDFRSDTIEYILCGSLFPRNFSVRDKIKHWMQVFSGFDKVEIKALEKILEQKQRMQQEMQRYLSYRQMKQGTDAPEMQKKILFCFRVMSRAFSDPPKAEQNFQILDQLKDTNVWKILTNLLDPNTSAMQASAYRDDMLKILTEKHRLYDFLGTLSIKCSYLLFNKEHVKEILAEVSAIKSAGNSSAISSCMNLLGLLACFCPALFLGAEEELIGFLKDDDEMIKEGALQILAKAGGTIRENLTVSSSSVDLMLERICMEGTRKQAKYAVHALASITKDDGLKSLSVLYKRLVDLLEDKTHLPAVLQCLGCIAQIAMPVFETREAEVVEFIKSKILKRKYEAVDDVKSWDDKSELCQLKIYGIKTLVKSYLPFNDAHLRVGVDDLIGLLKCILSFGEVSEDMESSSVDKAHLRLAAAKAVLRLSRHWDHKIPIDAFHLTLKTPEISFPWAKKIFLGKVHQYIKDRLLETKYACSFLFDITGPKLLESEEEKQNLAEIIQLSQQTKARQLSAQPDANSVTLYPEYILPHLIHVLAHRSCPDVDKCKDVKEYEMIYRQLYLVISMLLHKEDDGKSGDDNSKEQESLSIIITIFQNIKQSEDVVDVTKSKNSHAICELGLSIAKRLAKNEHDLQGMTTSVSLPPALFKPIEKHDGDDAQVSEDKIWLADETVLAHFNALKLETDASVTPEAAEVMDMKDGESDGNELPLGKIVERLKSQGTKTGKGRKNKSLPAEAENGGKDVDILKMVREINLDHLTMLNKFESSNGHEHSLGKRMDINEEDQKAKKRKISDSTSVPVPKRRRSSSGHSALKFSKSAAKVPLKAPKESRQERGIDEDDSSNTDNEISERKKGLESPIPPKKKKSSSSKRKSKGSGWAFSDEENESEGAHYVERKQSKLAESGDSTLRSSGSMKKRKRKSISGMAKFSTAESKTVVDELIGYRIKVWWPLDKAFYEGTVKSYDPTKNKHVILYDDGDVEVLRLDKERWELVDKGRKATKKLNASKGSPHKKGSSESKRKKSGGPRENKNQITTPKGKRTPKKNLRHGQISSSKSLNSEHSKEERAEKKDHISAASYDSPGEATEAMDGNLSDRDESDVEMKSPSEGRNPKGTVESPKSSGEADEEKSSSEGKSEKEDEEAQEFGNKKHDLREEEAESSKSSGGEETEFDNSDSEGKRENEEIETEPGNQHTDAEDTEVSDNETLGAWKLKVCKSSSRRAT